MTLISPFVVERPQAECSYPGPSTHTQPAREEAQPGQPLGDAAAESKNHPDAAITTYIITCQRQTHLLSLLSDQACPAEALG